MLLHDYIITEKQVRKPKVAVKTCDLADGRLSYSFVYWLLTVVCQVFVNKLY